MAKIAHIGSGSGTFSRRFISDVVTRPDLAEGSLALMDTNQENLDIVVPLGQKMAHQVGVPTKFEPTTDRREALDGAWGRVPHATLPAADAGHPCHVGDLPPQLAALNRARMAGDELAVKGALEGDRQAVEQAVALDPLTAAVCSLDQIHGMVEEIFEGLDPYLGELT